MASASILNSKKLVYPASMVHDRHISRYGTPKEWDDVLGDCNYSVIASGRSGSGKDATVATIMNYDLRLGRTVIILDVKMEYPLSIFCQRDTVLANILRRHGLYGRGYKVKLWIPYIAGMENNHHFQQLMRMHHPNLEIRPFRILTTNLISEDSANMAVSKTQLQSMAKKEDLQGQSAQLAQLREEMARIKMAYDNEPMKEEGEDTGWEYIDMDKLSNNKCINVISTFFMFGKNSVAATSFMIGVLNELITVGKSVHRQRSRNELFTVVIPEVQIIMPKRVKALEEIVNTLKFNMLTGLLLMRSFGVRLRINLQNLSSLDPDMLSQSRIFVGRTWNFRDLKSLSHFGIQKEDQIRMTKLKTGEFVDVMRKKRFSIVPFCHKAKENQPLVRMLQLYAHHPAVFLFETDDMLLSEIEDYHVFFDNRPLTVQEYERRVRRWIRNQKPRKLKPVPAVPPSEIDSFADATEQYYNWERAKT